MYVQAFQSIHPLILKVEYPDKGFPLSFLTPFHPTSCTYSLIWLRKRCGLQIFWFICLCRWGVVSHSKPLLNPIVLIHIVKFFKLTKCLKQLAKSHITENISYHFFFISFLIHLSLSLCFWNLLFLVVFTSSIQNESLHLPFCLLQVKTIKFITGHSNGLAMQISNRCVWLTTYENDVHKKGQ